MPPVLTRPRMARRGRLQRERAEPNEVRVSRLTASDLTVDFVIDDRGAWFVLAPHGDKRPAEPGWLLSYRYGDVFLPASEYEQLWGPVGWYSFRERATGNVERFERSSFGLATVTIENDFAVVESARDRLVLRNAPLAERWDEAGPVPPALVDRLLTMPSLGLPGLSTKRRDR